MISLYLISFETNKTSNDEYVLSDRFMVE